jgi:hypothetical protein
MGTDDDDLAPEWVRVVASAADAAAIVEAWLTRLQTPTAPTYEFRPPKP